MFKKWLSIENHYQMKHIIRFFNMFPELWKEKFIITEKIDGANVSLVFTPDGNVEFNKRSGKCSESFFNHQEAFKDDNIKLFMENISAFCMKHNRTLQLVGELYGDGINGRVWYGIGRFWRWYAIYEHLDEEEVILMSVDDQEHLMEIINPYIWQDYYIPVVGYRYMNDYNNWEELIDSINIRVPSLLTPKDYIGHEKGGINNLIEGIVIRPYKESYRSPIGKMFVIKYKNQEFMDNKSSKKQKKKIDISEELQKLIDIGLDMINSNRTTDLFSKEGELEEMKNFGNYIKLYTKDIFEDFMKDEVNKNIFVSLEKAEQKIFNKTITGSVAMELRGNL